MKHYGFNPFVVCEKSKNFAVVYDLLEGEKYLLPPEICDCFSGSYYKSKKEIDSILKKFDPIEIEEIFEEGITKGLIVETKSFCFKEEVVTDFFKSQRRKVLLRRIMIQPSGICNINCNLCEKYINCLCQRNSNSWTKDDIYNFFADLETLKYDFYELIVIGGNLLEYKHLNLLIKKISDLDPNRVTFNLLVERLMIKDLYKFISVTNKYKFRKIINLKVLIENDIEIFKKKILKIKKFDYYLNQIGVKSSIDIMISKLNDRVATIIEEIKPLFQYLNLELLYNKDLKNIENLRIDNINHFTENVDHEEFYFRKISHRCWSFSLSISSNGEIKPCFWSKKILGNWEKGRFKHVMVNPSTYNFWVSNSIDNKASSKCKKCALRYCCKHCRVIEEYKPEIFREICNFKIY